MGKSFSMFFLGPGALSYVQIGPRIQNFKKISLVYVIFHPPKSLHTFTFVIVLNISADILKII